MGLSEAGKAIERGELVEIGIKEYRKDRDFWREIKEEKVKREGWYRKRGRRMGRKDIKGREINMDNIM